MRYLSLVLALLVCGTAWSAEAHKPKVKNPVSPADENAALQAAVQMECEIQSAVLMAAAQVREALGSNDLKKLRAAYRDLALLARLKDAYIEFATTKGAGAVAAEQTLSRLGVDDVLVFAQPIHDELGAVGGL